MADTKDRNLPLDKIRNIRTCGALSCLQNLPFFAKAQKVGIIAKGK